MQIGPSLGLLQALGTPPARPEQVRAVPDAATRVAIESARAIMARPEVPQPAHHVPQERAPADAQTGTGARGRRVDILV